MADFVHLHVHTDYSLLHGAVQVRPLIARVRELGMRSVAMTDSGHLFGAIDFYSEAVHEGVRPIVGMEAFVAPHDRREHKDVPGLRDACHHVTLLVRNERGYANLLRLSSAGWQEGHHHKPRIDKELLRECRDGLVVLSGCLHSEFARACVTGDTDKAEAVAAEWRDLVGTEHYYLEIQDHGLEEEKAVRRGALLAARRLGLKVVATNNVHYLHRDDAKAHDVLLAISSGRQIHDPDRPRHATPEYYLKSPDEMERLFGDHPEALKATAEIAEKCNLELKFGQVHLPRFELPAGETSAGSYLRRLCLEGAKRHYGDPVPPHVLERLDYEAGVMDKLGFASYFLIVWDLLRFARESGLPVGPGRGSAAGSLVAYCLDITKIDPLRYDLIFERFLNPSRKEMPDIDLDFSDRDRGRVIEYIRTKYGGENVAQIITYGRMKARMVVRDVGRVMGVDLREVDALAKKIPKDLDITLAKALEREPELPKLLAQQPVLKELWEVAGRLEGMSRNAGRHASGVVVSDRPLVEHLPLYVHEGASVTQYDMKALTKLGLLKIDVLGLETLSVLTRAVELIERTRGVRIDLRTIPLDDRPTYDMLARGQVKGVFQMETSRGMRELVQNMKPDRIEDVIATIALFRPGPLQSGMVETFVRCKHGQEPIKFLHPSLEPILRETYGVILYQEQVMRIANVMAGFSMADADALRKAMGKKIPEIMAKFKDQFVKGAVKNGVAEDLAVQVFDLMAFFAGYGFNKSHSAAYGFVTYQTAHLKANYPVEFMTALLSCSIGSSDKTAEYLEECRQMGIEVRPPDVNLSGWDFVIENGAIRFGLGAVKNIGERAVHAIVHARERAGRFATLHDFAEAIDPRLVEQRAVESLVKAGAFDSTGASRRQLMEGLETAMREGALRRQDREAGQMTFFDSAPAGRRGPDLPEVPEWEQDQLLAFEKEALGFYVSSNPVVRYENEIRTYSTSSVDALRALEEGTEVTLGGMLSGLSARTTKTGRNKGSRFVTCRFTDLSGSCEAVFYAREFEENREHLHEDAIVFLTARIGFRNDEPSLRASKIVPIQRVREQLTSSIRIRLGGAGFDGDGLARLEKVLRSHPGAIPVTFEVTLDGSRAVLVQAPNDIRVSPSDALLADIEDALGEGHVRFVGRAPDRSPAPAWRRSRA